MRKPSKYQFGGEEEAGADSTSFFHSMLDAYEQLSAQPEAEEAPVEEAAAEEGEDDYNPDYEALQADYDELQEKYNQLSSPLPQDNQFNDGFLDFLFDDDNRGPVDFDNLNIPSNGAYRSSGGMAYSAGASKGLDSEIAAVESGGNYKAFNPAGGGAGAVGKYQFRWNIWKDDIANVTGIRDKNAFLNNPDAQERYYASYKQRHLLPTANKIARYNKAGLSQDQLAKLVHFRGEQGAIDYLTGKVGDKPEVYNMSISKYIGKRQHGGVAQTAQQKYEGLNNPEFNEMFFPMQGQNTFRGLDNGQPVMLMDEAGNKKILNNKYEIATMQGNVYEKRIN